MIRFGGIAGIAAESVARGTSATLEWKARRVLKEDISMPLQKKKIKKAVRGNSLFSEN